MSKTIIEYEKMDRLVMAVSNWIEKYDPNHMLQPGQILGLLDELLPICEKEIEE